MVCSSRVSSSGSLTLSSSHPAENKTNMINDKCVNYGYYDSQVLNHTANVYDMTMFRSQLTIYLSNTFLINL